MQEMSLKIDRDPETIVAASVTSAGDMRSSGNQAQIEAISERRRSERLEPIYAGSVKEQTIPKVQVEEKLCPMGTMSLSMAFKEREVPDTFSETKGPVGETNEGFWQSLGARFTQPIPLGYTQQLKLDPPLKYSGQRRPGV